MSNWPTSGLHRPAPSRESYLVADKIIAACKATGAQAVHPGYGFLSENEDFARRVEEEGITFIGPKHYSIAAMGDKIASKKLAGEAKVSTIPGWNGHRVARGGGEDRQGHRLPGDDQGQRRRRRQGPARGLQRQGSLRRLQQSCRNEAKNSFGDDRVFIEKYVESRATSRSRCWATATATWSTCTSANVRIQRRHQKVIEEAPSPFISDATRQAMGAQAVALAKAVKYQSAGTVEFVVGKDQSFYFLEMNTRLQVEHPVTESITGIDLVEQMIRVAAARSCPSRRRRSRAAAGPSNAASMPRTRSAASCRPPAAWCATCRRADHGSGRVPVPQGGGVRVDTGVYEGGEIPMYYDSMIAKLIVHGVDRNDAIAKMREALNGFVIRGCQQQHPVPGRAAGAPEVRGRRLQHRLHRRALRPKGFRAEDVPHDDPDFLVALAGAAYRRYRERAAGISGQLAGHGVVIGERLRGVVKGQGGEHQHVPVQIKARAPHRDRGRQGLRHQRRLALRRHPRHGNCNGPRPSRPRSNATACGCAWNTTACASKPGDERRAAELLRVMPFKAPADMSKFLLSPMPGLLVDVAVKPGQVVQAGERLAVIEAMKMENILTAAQDGTVSRNCWPARARAWPSTNPS
jgi:propionyl-CoA carboxylase alpha chain